VREKILIGEYRWYIDLVTGTKFDVPLAEAFKYGDRQNFDRYIWLGYRKGALVWYVFDTVIQSVTNGSKSLDDLQRIVYDLYGGHQGSYSSARFLLVNWCGVPTPPVLTSWVGGQSLLVTKRRMTVRGIALLRLETDIRFDHSRGSLPRLLGTLILVLR